RGAEPLPLHDEIVERAASFDGESVVAAWRTAQGLTPRRCDEPISAQSREERIYRSLARDHPVDLLERPHDVEAVALLVAKEGENAILDHPAAELREETAPRSSTGPSGRSLDHAGHGTWSRKIARPFSTETPTPHPASAS